MPTLVNSKSYNVSYRMLFPLRMRYLVSNLHSSMLSNDLIITAYVGLLVCLLLLLCERLSVSAIGCQLVAASYLFHDAAVCQIACHIEYLIFLYFIAILYFLTDQSPITHKYCDCCKGVSY